MVIGSIVKLVIFVLTLAVTPPGAVRVFDTLASIALAVDDVLDAGMLAGLAPHQHRDVVSRLEPRRSRAHQSASTPLRR